MLSHNITFVRWMDLEMANSLKSLHPFPPIDRTDHRRRRTLCYCQLTCFQQWYRVYRSSSRRHLCFIPLGHVFSNPKDHYYLYLRKRTRSPVGLLSSSLKMVTFLLASSGKTFLGRSLLYGNGNTYGKKVRRERWSLEKKMLAIAIVYYTGYTKQHTQDYSKSLTH